MLIRRTERSWVHGHIIVPPYLPWAFYLQTLVKWEKAACIYLSHACWVFCHIRLKTKTRTKMHYKKNQQQQEENTEKRFSVKKSYQWELGKVLFVATIISVYFKCVTFLCVSEYRKHDLTFLKWYFNHNLVPQAHLSEHQKSLVG